MGLFAEQFGLQIPAIVNFVGGGGKTTLILKLAREYSSTLPVIYTTTVRIHPPHPEKGLVQVACDDPNLHRTLLERSLHSGLDWVRILVATRPSIAPGLLGGVAPDFARKLDRADFPLILNEADGARSMSLKMPRDGEPVLMEEGEYLIPVIGLDCLNKPLGPETLFRWETAFERYSLEQGQILTPELAASLLLHPDGVCKGWKPRMRIVPYINKADSKKQDSLARKLASELLQNERFPIERVVWGSLRRGRAASLTAKRS